MTLLNPAEILWTAAAQILKEQVSEGVWLASFAEATGLYLDENCLTIAVSNPFVRDRIDQRYRELCSQRSLTPATPISASSCA